MEWWPLFAMIGGWIVTMSFVMGAMQSGDEKASAIEARRAADAEGGAVEDESAMPQADAKTISREAGA